MFRTPLTLDRANRVLTVVVVAILVPVLGFAVVAGRHGGIAVAALLGGVLLVAWAMGPSEVVVEDGELRIERRAWAPVRIPLSEVESAAPVTRLGGKLLRLFGVGGFFGSYGLFWCDSLGRFRLYATRRGQAVLVRRRGALPLVLTPDDVTGTVEAIDPRPTH